MFKLYGAPLSNYYNIVKLAMLEKGLDFEEIYTMPSQAEEFLAISPLGKIPVLEVREGFISETQVIVEFLEDIYPEIPLFPKDPFKKAAVRRLCHISEKYIDGAARPLLATVFGGKVLEEHRKSRAVVELKKGVAALEKLAAVKPWLTGENFSAADIFAYYCLAFADFIAGRCLDVNIDELSPVLSPWRRRMAERELVIELDRAQQADMQKMLKK
ncbi:MAG: glutathione S-transferase family protein [Porticoccaceae bacterium]|nr:glutathione S-transferase family protein [Porticoccaceae bacterium]